MRFSVLIPQDLNQYENAFKLQLFLIYIACSLAFISLSLDSHKLPALQVTYLMSYLTSYFMSYLTSYFMSYLTSYLTSCLPYKLPAL